MVDDDNRILRSTILDRSRFVRITKPPGRNCSNCECLVLVYDFPHPPIYQTLLIEMTEVDNNQGIQSISILQTNKSFLK